MNSGMISLRVFPSSGEIFEKSLKAGSVVIGRASGCGLPSADASLSREHARIYRDGDGWSVEDLGSHNGIFVKEEKISAPRPLVAGDVITLGCSRIIVDLPSPSRAVMRTTSEYLGGRSVLRPASDLLKSGTPDLRDIGRAARPMIKRYAERLHLLNEVHQALPRPTGLKDLMELILDRVFLHLRPEEGSIFLRSGDGAIERVACRSLQQDTGTRFASQTLAEEVVEKGLTALVQDAFLDERFEQAESVHLAGVRSLVAAPLLDAEGTLGMIVLFSKAPARPSASFRICPIR